RLRFAGKLRANGDISNQGSYRRFVGKCGQRPAFAGVEGRKRAMKRAKLTERISYRITEEDWRRIEAECEDAGVSANDWCGDGAREKLKNLREGEKKSTRAETGNGTGGVVNERALLEEIARLGYLIEHGFGIQLAPDMTTNKEWVRRVKESKSTAALLVGMMLAGRSSGAGMG